jgi:hypothetical protein
MQDFKIESKVCARKFVGIFIGDYMHEMGIKPLEVRSVDTSELIEGAQGRSNNRRPVVLEW